jgi:hypothetical protein
MDQALVRTSEAGTEVRDAAAADSRWGGGSPARPHRQVQEWCRVEGTVAHVQAGTSRATRVGHRWLDGEVRPTSTVAGAAPGGRGEQRAAFGLVLDLTGVIYPRQHRVIRLGCSGWLAGCATAQALRLVVPVDALLISSAGPRAFSGRTGRRTGVAVPRQGVGHVDAVPA